MRRRRDRTERSAAEESADSLAPPPRLGPPPIESLLAESLLAASPLAVSPLAVSPLAVSPLAVSPLAVSPLAVSPLAASPPRGAARIGVLTVGRGQLARDLAQRWPEAQVECLVLDSFQAALAAEAGAVPGNLQIACAADWLAGQYDLMVIPLRRRESAELNRDLVQSALMRLRCGGDLWVGVDSPSHPALLEELRGWARPVECRTESRGVVFHLRKGEELKRVRDFRAEVVFRDQERLLQLVTRPGVFSHRQFDPGARQILKAVTVSPGTRILDVGCGSGAIAVALAARDPAAEIWAVDSHARAVEATRLAAQLNGLSNLHVVLSHQVEVPGPGSFDLVTGNPPYFANFEIARRFLDGAVRALRPGGECVLVTKLPAWYREHASQWLDDVELRTSGHYHLVRGRRREASA